MPFWHRSFESDAQLEREYHCESQQVRQGLNVDLEKCFAEGKSIIIEGLHIDTGLFDDVFDDGALSASEKLAATKISGDEDTAGKEASARPSVAIHNRRGIVVPFLLELQDEEVHGQLIEDWLRSQNPADLQQLGANESDTEAMVKKLFAHFRKLQGYLTEKNRFFIRLPVNPKSTTDTLNRMHTKVLQAMQDFFDRNLALNVKS